MQQRLAALNACALAANFLHRGIEVVIADLITPDTSRIYREQLPGCCIVRLAVSWPEAQRRARTRRVWLTDDELRRLHEGDAASPPSADAHLGVDDLTVAEQLTLVDRMWNGIRLS